MALTPKVFCIVCPLLFIAGFVDSIGGGGGLISLPAYIFAGLPMHAAIATNKLSSACGTSLATARFIRNRLVNWRIALPGVAAAILGAAIGAKLSLLASERLIRAVLFVALPVAAFFVLNRRLFPDHEEGNVQASRRTITVSTIAALLVGTYDGFYGPGTGTFLIIAFTVFAKMGVSSANAHTKVINLTTNITSLAVFLRSGQVVIPLGLAAAACNMLGNYIGSGLAMSKGAKITRPIILIVLVLLLLKILLEK